MFEGFFIVGHSFFLCASLKEEYMGRRGGKKLKTRLDNRTKIPHQRATTITMSYTRVYYIQASLSSLIEHR